MTTETWDPTQASSKQTNYKIEDAFLQCVIKQIDQLQDNNITGLLTPDEQKNHAAIMQLDKETWLAKKDTLTNDEIVSLIKFFTLAEMQFEGWSAEEKSPVIWLTKLLRHKGSVLNKELLLWIKAHSSNKFLPNGAL